MIHPKRLQSQARLHQFCICVHTQLHAEMAKELGTFPQVQGKRAEHAESYQEPPQGGIQCAK